MYLIFTVLSAAGHVLHYVLSLYTWIVIIAALLSWVRPDPYNPIVRTLAALTAPVFWRVRRALPFTYLNGLDLSPVVVLLAVQFADLVLIRCVAYVDMQLRILGA